MVTRKMDRCAIWLRLQKCLTVYKRIALQMKPHQTVSIRLDAF